MYENISYKVKEREDQTVEDQEVKKEASGTQVGNVFKACKNNHVSIYQCRQKYEEKHTDYHRNIS